MENKEDVEIIPAILPQDYFEIEEGLERVLGKVSTVQIDVVDGIFVKDIKTWPYNSTGDAHYNSLLLEEESLPFFDQISFEIDLMVSEPLTVWQDWITVGAKRIIAHIEAIEDKDEFLRQAKEMNVPHDSFFHVETGVAIDINTPNYQIAPLIPHIDFVQCMGIANIGKQGEPFDDRVVDKIKDLKKEFPNLIISVDGGVNDESAPKLLDAGVERLVSGSFIFNSDDVEEAIKILKG